MCYNQIERKYWGVTNKGGIMGEIHNKFDSERYYFTMYWNVDTYNNGIKYVFCDEIDGYTFYPYIGKIKNLPEYNQDEVLFENANIYLPYKTQARLEKVPCIIVEEMKKIYLLEGHFNKYWKQISERIWKEIRKKTKNYEKTQMSVNEMVDLSLLKTPTRTAKVGTEFKIQYESKELDIEVQRLISKRASAMEDSQIRFIYSKKDNLVHDKKCTLISKINYEDFCASKELPSDREICNHCKRKIFIRNAIISDNKRFAWYFRFFENGKVKNQVLEKYLYHTNMRLHMNNIDQLIIKYKEDTWYIERNDEGRYLLYHNNYVMINDKERYITTGFHLQKNHPPYLVGIFAYIEGYNWQKHLQSKKKLEKSTHSVSKKEVIEESVYAVSEQEVTEESAYAVSQQRTATEKSVGEEETQAKRTTVLQKIWNKIVKIFKKYKS